jgi:hypothetical protein
VPYTNQFRDGLYTWTGNWQLHGGNIMASGKHDDNRVDLLEIGRKCLTGAAHNGTFLDFPFGLFLYQNDLLSILFD